MMRSADEGKADKALIFRLRLSDRPRNFVSPSLNRQFGNVRECDFSHRAIHPNVIFHTYCNWDKLHRIWCGTRSVLPARLNPARLYDPTIWTPPKERFNVRLN
jgi:hypothetical protein